MSIRKAPQGLQEMLDNYSKVFETDFGQMINIFVQLKIKPGYQPKYCKPRVVHYVLQPPMEADLDCLVRSGVFSPAAHSEQATPIVSVIKKKSSVQIYGDFTRTLNLALCAVQYPLPCIEGLFTALSGGRCVSKLDLSNSYLQIEVDPASNKYLTKTLKRNYTAIIDCFLALQLLLPSSRKP